MAQRKNNRHVSFSMKTMEAVERYAERKNISFSVAVSLLCENALEAEEFTRRILYREEA